ncbi:MarR family transcriptional regulator [Nocardiopsis sp. EMB25]|uniref:MarR family winged helix-turn-helix transcriptional regulator n=1 Tax=Nocardiopsis sp. EMB25 TaxID=2835867 RepID=UPI00228398F6|nr:MarR family transcriptional regulator [Nocardiopsis sp. EMB25]MCY9784019.1 MarR family transcriptional regulator [Nocardiopsis sp. EMB25]
MDDELLERSVRANHELFLLTGDRTEAALADLSLTHATASALAAIDPAEEPPTMKALAERLYCNAPNLTFLIDQLVDRNLVERVVARGDRRQRAVLLTDKGASTQKDLRAIILAASPLRYLDDEERLSVATALESALARAKQGAASV